MILRIKTIGIRLSPRRSFCIMALLNYYRSVVKQSKLYYYASLYYTILLISSRSRENGSKIKYIYKLWWSSRERDVTAKTKRIDSFLIDNNELRWIVLLLQKHSSIIRNIIFIRHWLLIPFHWLAVGTIVFTLLLNDSPPVGVTRCFPSFCYNIW